MLRTRPGPRLIGWKPKLEGKGGWRCHRQRRIVAACSEFLLAQRLQRCVNVLLVRREVKVRMGAHCTYLARLQRRPSPDGAERNWGSATPAFRFTPCGLQQCHFSGMIGSNR